LKRNPAANALPHATVPRRHVRRVNNLKTVMSRKSTNPRRRPHYERVKTIVARVRKLARKPTMSNR
jgi:hypothetical protein